MRTGPWNSHAAAAQKVAQAGALRTFAGRDAWATLIFSDMSHAIRG
jgi:hypothetical protein